VQKSVPLYGEFVGTLVGVKTVDIRARVEGFLAKRDFVDGADVKEGQLLFGIDQKPFLAALAGCVVQGTLLWVLRRRATAIGGYSATAVLNALIGVATAAWQVGVLRTGAWLTRGLRTPSRSALLTDLVSPEVYGRAYGFERAMDNLGAIVGALLALVLVSLVGVREAILLSFVPGFLAAAAIFVAIKAAPRLEKHERPPLLCRLLLTLVLLFNVFQPDEE
jgi:MFS family permease